MKPKMEIWPVGGKVLNLGGDHVGEKQMSSWGRTFSTYMILYLLTTSFVAGTVFDFFFFFFLLLSDLIFTQPHEVCAFIIYILDVRKLSPSEIE